MGNAPYSPDIIEALESREGESALLDEHICWAKDKQYEKRQQDAVSVLPASTKRLVRIVEKGLPRDA